jgi:hypothetical protein
MATQVAKQAETGEERIHSAYGEWTAAASAAENTLRRLWDGIAQVETELAPLTNGRPSRPRPVQQ